MYKQGLTRSVIWPRGKNAAVALVKTGETVEGDSEVGRFLLQAPMAGRDLAGMVPPGHHIELHNAEAVGLVADGSARTVGEFATAVVPTARRVSMEERLMHQLQKMERKYAAKVQRLEADLIGRREEAPEVIEEPEPASEPAVETEPEVAE